MPWDYLRSLAKGQTGEERLRLGVAAVASERASGWAWTHGEEVWAGLADVELPGRVALLQGMKLAVEDNANVRGFTFAMDAVSAQWVKRALVGMGETHQEEHYLEFLRERVRSGEIEILGGASEEVETAFRRAESVVAKVGPSGARVRLRDVPLAGLEVAEYFREWAGRMERTVCYTDGSYQGERSMPNFGVGGWCWFVSEEEWNAGTVREGVDTNVMEIEAVRRALLAMPERRLAIVTDSACVVDAMAGRSEHGGAREVAALGSARDVEVLLIKGHKDPSWHSRADQLARRAMQGRGAESIPVQKQVGEEEVGVLV